MKVSHECTTPKKEHKEHCPSVRCPIHEDFELDSVCFHRGCLSSSSQLTCVVCSTSEKPHCDHQSQVFPIYKSSPGFRLLEHTANPELVQYIEGQKQIIADSVEKLQRTFASVMTETVPTL